MTYGAAREKFGLVWWRECLARSRKVRYVAHYRGSPVFVVGGQPSSLGASLWPAGSRRLFEPLATFKSWIGFEPMTFRL